MAVEVGRMDFVELEFVKAVESWVAAVWPMLT